MNGLYDYMSEKEYQIHVIESVVDNKIKHLNAEFDKLMIEHTVNLNDIETKVIMEYGTNSDLEELYMIEAEEMRAQTGGVVGKLIRTVRGFFKKIRDVLFGKKEETINPDSQVVPKENPDDVIKEGNSLIASMRDFKNKHKRGIKMAATSAAIGAGVAIGWKVFKPKLDKMKKQSEVVDEELEEIERLILNSNDSLSNQELINAKILTNRAQQYGKYVLSFSNLTPSEKASKEREVRDDVRKTAAKLDKIDGKAAPYARQINNLQRKIDEIEGNIQKQEQKYERLQKGGFHPIANHREKRLRNIENTSKFLRTNQDKADYAKLSKKDPARYIQQLEAELEAKQREYKKTKDNYDKIVGKKSKLLK